MISTKKPLHWSFACALVVFGAFAADAEDWPDFRGPTGQGHSAEKNLPIEWSADKNIAWKTAISGQGWSSPILVKDRVYLTAAVPTSDAEKPDFSLRLLCLDATSGSIVWNEEVFLQDGSKAPGIHSKNSHASPTPVFSSSRIYVHFGHMGTACYEPDGKALWKTQELKYPPVHGNGSTPVIVDGLLVFTADGASDPLVVALDTATGKEHWRYKRPEVSSNHFAFATPLVIEVDGKKQIIAPGGGSVSAIKPGDGTEIWRMYYGSGYSVIPRPVYAHGLVFVSSSYDKPIAFAIRPTGEGDVTETHVAWKTDKAAPHTPSMLVVGDEFYMVSDGGIASCLDAKTGEQHWQQRLGGNFSASPVFADGKIYFQDEQGKGTVIKPGKKFDKLGENGFADERTLSSYAIGDGAIFIRTDKHLYRVQK